MIKNLIVKPKLVKKNRKRTELKETVNIFYTDMPYRKYSILLMTYGCIRIKSVNMNLHYPFDKLLQNPYNSRTYIWHLFC